MMGKDWLFLSRPAFGGQVEGEPAGSWILREDRDRGDPHTGPGVQE